MQRRFGWVGSVVSVLCIVGASAAAPEGQPMELGVTKEEFGKTKEGRKSISTP